MTCFLLVSLFLGLGVAHGSSALERQCAAMSSQFTAVGNDAACASAGAQVPAIFSGLEASIPSGVSTCDLTSPKNRFSSVASCSDLANAFNIYCSTLGSCQSGGSSSPSPSKSPPPSPSPSPPPPPPPPKELVLRLKLVETAIDNATIIQIKQYFVTLLGGAGIVVTLDAVKLDIPNQTRRRLLSEMTITVSISVEPDTQTDAFIEDFSKPAALEDTKTRFVGFGLTLTSLEIAQPQGASGQESLSGGIIAAIVLGVLVGLCLLLIAGYFLLKMNNGVHPVLWRRNDGVNVSKPAPPVAAETPVIAGTPMPTCHRANSASAAA